MAKKKGIQMGIEFVIVIVMAVLILTLGTGFIQNLFKNINIIGGQITEEAIKKLSEDLKKDSNQKCALTTGDEAIAKRDVTNTFKVLVSNTDPTSACYKLEGSFRSVGNNILKEGKLTDPTVAADYEVDIVKRTLVLGKEVKPLQVLMNVNPNVNTGKYQFNFVLERYKPNLKVPVGGKDTPINTVCEDANVGTISGTGTTEVVCSKNFILHIET